MAKYSIQVLETAGVGDVAVCRRLGGFHGNAEP